MRMLDPIYCRKCGEAEVPLTLGGDCVACRTEAVQEGVAAIEAILDENGRLEAELHQERRRADRMAAYISESWVGGVGGVSTGVMVGAEHAVNEHNEARKK